MTALIGQYGPPSAHGPLAATFGWGYRPARLHLLDSSTPSPGSKAKLRQFFNFFLESGKVFCVSNFRHMASYNDAAARTCFLLLDIARCA